LITSACLYGALFFILHNYAINFFSLSHYNSQKPSLLLDDIGNEWGRFQLDKKNPVEGALLPQHVVNAFIAAEDWNFFSHNGISWKGIIRSIVVNLYRGRRAQGASTITQQLVKLLFFDSQKTFTRKIKEQVYALIVEAQFSKDHILQTYLNHVCFGCGIYGVEAASQRFWSKHTSDISIDEAATLAGIICSPTRYCPLLYPLSAEKRRNSVLRKMLHLGFITDQEYIHHSEKPIEIIKSIHENCAPHYKEMIRSVLENSIGKTALYTQGLSVKTTINRQMQQKACEVFTTEISNLRKQLGNDLDGGMIVIDRRTGEIKALVGGYDFTVSKFNRATQAKRQIGSTFKPLIYAQAVASGMKCSDTEIDEPLEIRYNNSVWTPKNYNKKFNGMITLAYALSHSNNIVSIKTFLRLNAQELVTLAKKCRLQGISHSYPSLALGCVDATLIEVAGMFNIFANDGVYIAPHIISWVKDQWGTRIYKPVIEQERVLSSCITGQIASVLRLGIERVRYLYKPQEWITTEAISKTGTTNDSRTCWFVGSTPSLTTAVYVGFDDNRPMGDGVYPVKTAFPIWLAFNRQIPSPEKYFSYDSSLSTVTINEKTGELCNPGTPGAITIVM